MIYFVLLAVGLEAKWNSIEVRSIPLLLVLLLGGFPLIFELVWGLIRGELGADFLAAISIATSLILGEYLAGAFVVLMLSGGQALEAYAVRSASAVLEALASRMPSIVHREAAGGEETVRPDQIQPGDKIIIYPHEICPVDGSVIDGIGSMDESYLSGEPYQVPKSLGSAVMSGAVNGQSVLKIRATHAAVDSRYAKIMRVMQDSAQKRPNIRRLGDKLGALYTPLAIVVAVAAWWFSGDPSRFLGVLVVATPCPLLIAIPVVVIGSISLAAKHGIIIKNPAILERLDLVQTAMFDKTGTLTYGRPVVTDIDIGPTFDRHQAIQLAASLERFSTHPLSAAVTHFAEAERVPLLPCEEVHEIPGEGLRGKVAGREILITSRKKFTALKPEAASLLPDRSIGLECVVAIDGQYGSLFKFRDQPREEGNSFIRHLQPKHGISRILLISGDREEEVRYLAEQMGITEVYASQSPEEKLEIVRRETAKGDSLYVGDGLNDAPALTAATIGIAVGRGSEITGEAADAVVMDSSLQKIDQLLHIGKRMRRIALESAVGGMALSIIGMLFAFFGLLPPVAGAMVQEGIDIIAVLNALRAAAPPRNLTDFEV